MADFIPSSSELARRQFHSWNSILEKFQPLALLWIITSTKIISEPIHIIFEGPLSSGAEGLFSCSLLNRGQLAQKYFPGYCHLRQWAIAAITAASSTLNIYLSNRTNTAHSQPLCPQRPSNPSSSLLQPVTTISVQMPIRKSNRNTLQRVMPPF